MIIISSIIKHNNITVIVNAQLVFLLTSGCKRSFKHSTLDISCRDQGTTAP